MENKVYEVDFTLEYFVRVSAKNETEARKKAMARLSRKNPTTLIRKNWGTNRKDINVNERIR